MRNKLIAALMVGTVIAIGSTGCEKKGPLEQAAEEVDEAIDTAKNGKESTATKIDDAVDELRDKK